MNRSAAFESPQVRLEDPEVPIRDRLIDPLWHCPDDLELSLADRLLGDRWRKILACDFVPAHPEVLGNVHDGGPFDASAGVVPAYCRPCRVIARVVAVAGLRGEIDATDERHPVVDHDRLLVVAVHRPLMRVEATLDLRPRDQAIPHLPYRLPRRAKQRQRCPRPHEHSHLDALGKFGQQVPHHRRGPLAGKRKVRREIPTGDMNMRPGPLELSRHPGQCLRPVDQHFGLVALSGERLPSCPTARWRVERAFPTDPMQPPPMVTTGFRFVTRSARTNPRPGTRVRGYAPPRSTTRKTLQRFEGVQIQLWRAPGYPRHPPHHPGHRALPP